MTEESRGLLTPEAAKSLAADLFSWVANEPAILARLMTSSGLDAGTVRAAASDPAFLCGVLDFAVGDDAIVIAYARHAGIAPGRVGAAWAALNNPSARRS